MRGAPEYTPRLGRLGLTSLPTTTKKASPLGVRFEVLRADAAHRAEQDVPQPARVDVAVDGRGAEPQSLRDQPHGQEVFGTEVVCPPQIRRNLVREHVSIRSIGWIPWQAFDGCQWATPNVVEGLPRFANACHAVDNSGRRFGTKGSQVQILSPRPSKWMMAQGFFTDPWAISTMSPVTCPSRKPDLAPG